MQNSSLYTVVVADDEDELREAICRMIPWEELGFRLVGDAQNGLDALELVEQLEPDLLLTDIRMPFISGIELARQVREIRPAIHIAFLSGYDDFEYAKQAIQYNIISYMLKPVTLDGISLELTRIREKIDEQFRAFQQQTQRRADCESFVMPLVLDGFASAPREAENQRIATAAVSSGLWRSADDRPRMHVAVTMFRDAQGVNCTQQANGHAVDMILKKYLRHVSFYSCGKVVSVLAGNPSDFEEYLHILTSELLQMSERVLQLHCSIGVSREIDGFAGLHGGYREAMDALSYAETASSDVEYITDVQRMTPSHADSLSEQVEQVKGAFKSGDRAQLGRSLSALVSAANTERYGKNWLDMAALQIVSGIYQAMYLGAGSEAMTELQNQGGMSALEFHYTGVEELRASLGAFCAAAMDLLDSQRKKGSSLICRQALDAIDRSYRDESLSLVSLSAMLHVSPNHLSACIKKDTGESFINILIQKRMAVAQELLLHTDRKILDIAQECGYSDQHYFSYCFKKYCGLSPVMMRRQSRAEEGSVL